MKTLIVFSILFVFLFMNASAQTVESKIEKPKVSTLEVYSIHELEVNPDVDIKEFETFVMKEIAPLYNKMKGQNLYLVKGDRGIRTDKYAVLLTFESVEDRNRIYPPSGGFSEEFNEVFEGRDSIWDKFNSMAKGFDGTTHTDYVRVAQ